MLDFSGFTCRSYSPSQVITKICKAQIEAMLQDVHAEVDRLKTGISSPVVRRFLFHAILLNSIKPSRLPNSEPRHSSLSVDGASMPSAHSFCGAKQRS